MKVIIYHRGKVISQKKEHIRTESLIIGKAERGLFRFVDIYTYVQLLTIILYGMHVYPGVRKRIEKSMVSNDTNDTGASSSSS